MKRADNSLGDLAVWRKVFIPRKHSQAVIKALDSPQAKSKLTWDCKNPLNWLGNQIKMIPTWVPEHEGNRGNVKTDELVGVGSSAHKGPRHYRVVGIAYKVLKETSKVVSRLVTRSEAGQKVPGCTHHFHSEQIKWVCS
ncbi:hypothetical protein Trydic_g1718 [Trypoxylus dichotomus]